MIAKVAQHKGNRINDHLNNFYKANPNRDDLVRRYDPQQDNIGKIINFINNEFESYERDNFDFGFSRSFDNDIQPCPDYVPWYEDESDYKRDIRDRTHSGSVSQSESRSERLPSKEEQVNSGRDSKTESDFGR